MDKKINAKHHKTLENCTKPDRVIIHQFIENGIITKKYKQNQYSNNKPKYWINQLYSQSSLDYGNHS